MPNAPTCAALSTRIITKTGLTTWPLIIAGILDAANDTTDDTGTAIPANTQWVATSPSAEIVLLEPAASSPMAGKFFMMAVAPTSGGPYSNAVLKQEASPLALNKLYIGFVWANAGTTISVAGNYSDWKSATPVTGTCYFGGFIGVSDTATMSQLVYRVTSDTVEIEVQNAAGGLYKAGGGAIIRGVSDGTNEGESGLLGAVFGYWCSGLATTMHISQWANAASSGNAVMFQNAATNAYAHFYFRPPGTSTLVACGINPSNGAATGQNMASGDDDAMLGADGSVEPENVMIHRHDTGRKVGRLRTHFWGPRKVNKTVLSDGATKKWIVDSGSSSATSDGFLCPI